MPDFVGDRYYSDAARLVAVFCAIFVSFTYVAGQMRGVGIVFSRFLEVPVNTGVIIGMVLVLTLGSKGRREMGLRGDQDNAILYQDPVTPAEHDQANR